MNITLGVEARVKNPKRVAAGLQGGRPGQDRVKHLQIRLTEEEHSMIMSAAKASNTTIADMFRNMLLVPEGPIVNGIPIIFKNIPTYLTPEQAKDLYKQLSKILIGD